MGIDRVRKGGPLSFYEYARRGSDGLRANVNLFASAKVAGLVVLMQVTTRCQ